MYQDYEPRTFTHDGKQYDLNTVFKWVDREIVTKVAVSELTWALPRTIIDEERLEKVDLTIPILVTMDVKRRIAVIDGAQRLIKAVNEGVLSLPAKWVSKTVLKKALIKK